jgi:hypothetical protein
MKLGKLMQFSETDGRLPGAAKKDRLRPGKAEEDPNQTEDSSLGSEDERQACQTIPLLGENSIAARNNPVATTTMLGPVGRSAWKDR